MPLFKKKQKKNSKVHRKSLSVLKTDVCIEGKPTLKEQVVVVSGSYFSLFMVRAVAYSMAKALQMMMGTMRHWSTVIRTYICCSGGQTGHRYWSRCVTGFCNLLSPGESCAGTHDTSTIIDPLTYSWHTFCLHAVDTCCFPLVLLKYHVLNVAWINK